jgi:hypothetical protein
MRATFKASLDSTQRIFALLVVTLADASVRNNAASQLLTLIKTAKVSSAAELGDVVRRAIVDMAEQSYANGLNLGHVDGIIQRVRRDGQIKRSRQSCACLKGCFPV